MFWVGVPGKDLFDNLALDRVDLNSLRVPWALNIEPLGSLAILEMALFVGVLLLGWLYALRKGALRWQ